MPLPLLAAAAPSILNAAKGVVDIIGGNSKYDKAKAEMDALKRPFYKIQDEYNQNRDIAGNRASQGYSDAQLDYLTAENERGLGAGISALSQGGGTNANDIAKILDSYNRTAARTAAEDAAIQTQNISQFFAANKDLAGQKTIQWHENEFQPWADKQSYLTQQMGIAKKTKDQGWNSIISGISGALSAGVNKDLAGVLNGVSGGASSVINPGPTPQVATVPAYNPAPMAPAPAAPQSFVGSDAVYQSLMRGGVPLGTNQIPSQGAGQPLQYQPIEFNFDVSKMWGG